MQLEFQIVNLKILTYETGSCSLLFFFPIGINFGKSSFLQLRKIQSFVRKNCWSQRSCNVLMNCMIQAVLCCIDELIFFLALMLRRFEYSLNLQRELSEAVQFLACTHLACVGLGSWWGSGEIT